MSIIVGYLSSQPNLGSACKLHTFESKSSKAASPTDPGDTHPRKKPDVAQVARRPRWNPISRHPTKMRKQREKTFSSRASPNSAGATAQLEGELDVTDEFGEGVDG
jgi:hypothetical protein